MNKQELQKKYQEIVLATNGGNDDYVVALCKIACAINELEDTKDLQHKLNQQKEMWNELKEFIQQEQEYNATIYERDDIAIEHIEASKVLLKMKELEKGENNEKIQQLLARLDALVEDLKNILKEK